QDTFGACIGGANDALAILQNDTVGQRCHHRAMPLLALTPLVLDACLFARVLPRAEIALRRSRRARFDFGDFVNMPHLAVRTQDAVFQIDLAPLDLRGAAGSDEARTVVGMKKGIDVVPDL